MLRDFDRETELRLMVGWWDPGSRDTQPTIETHTITDVPYMSAGCACAVSRLFNSQSCCLTKVYP